MTCTCTELRERAERAEAEAKAWRDNYDGMFARWVECDAERWALKGHAPTVEPGTVRDAAVFATCAVEPCATDATQEMMHAPGDGTAVWVPVCEFHLAVGPAGGFSYIIDLHGFVPGIEAS